MAMIRLSFRRSGGLLQLASLFILATLVVRQYYTQARNDWSKCGALLNHGQWSSTRTGGNWEPQGCRMIPYRSNEMVDCLRSRRVVFAGDSTIRRIFEAAKGRLRPGEAKHIEEPASPGDPKHTDPRHANVRLVHPEMELQFLWDPWLNSTEVNKELSHFYPRGKSEIDDLNLSNSDPGFNSESESDRPAILVAGAPGLWLAQHAGDSYLDLFNRTINTVEQSMHMPLDSHLLHPRIDALNLSHAALDQVLLTPVPVPAYHRLQQRHIGSLTPERIDRMNARLRSMNSSAAGSHVLWAFNRMTRLAEDPFDEAGIHVVDAVAESQLDVILNARCNSLAINPRNPQKTTCCMRHPLPSGQNQARLFITMLALACALLPYYTRLLLGETKWPGPLPKASLVLALVAFWCYICDRTPLFDKAERHYQPAAFVVSCGLWVLASLCSCRESIIRAGPARGESGFLSRPQCNELKGFMQGVILAYHYTHASGIPWIYRTVRLFMAMYLFLMAYGQTMGFLKTNDYSVRRSLEVLFRWNVLTVLVALVTNADYSQYYFTPLVSFWYANVLLTVWFGSQLAVWAGSRGHDRLTALVGGCFASCAASLCLSLWTVSWLTTVGELDDPRSNAGLDKFPVFWDAHEAWFRFRLDCLVPFFGIMTATVAYRYRQIRPLLDKARDKDRDGGIELAARGNAYMYASSAKLDQRLGIQSADRWLAERLTSPKWERISLGLSAVLLLFFGWSPHEFSKEASNRIHTVVSPLLVLAVLRLRNANRFCREHHLRIPAALGAISLETYVLQFHTLLASDATAVLWLGH